MRHYEAMYIVTSDTQDEALAATIEKYKKIVVDGGGEVKDAAKWDKGKRQLAYHIKKKKDGIYILMQFVAGAQVPKELDRVFRISEEVLRHLIVRQDDKEE